jgi:uncharacterized damage-inducible protein DinB
MNRSVKHLSIVALLIAGGAVATHAQAPKASSMPTSGFRAEFLRQLEDAEKKLIALSEAVPQEKYSWRPAEGVRSVSEVFMHVAGGNYLIPQAIGVKAPSGVGRDIEKISERAKVIDTLKGSFEHVRAALVHTSDADLEKPANLFGRQTTVRDVFFLMATHAHEHLGQAIAYARMNGVVPPWTAARQQQQQRPRQ